jgi:diadenosine tetraphosphate (Ap4A) HIT family hydrolase
MLHRAHPDDCFLCAAHGGGPGALAWYDRPLAHEPGTGIAVGAIGAFVPGYVLVSPAVHTRSVQDLPPGAHAAFLAFTRKVLARVEGRYGPATVFEHGACRAAGGRRSACVDHSHLHIVPGSYGLSRAVGGTRTFNSLADLLAAPREQRYDGYLMYREPGGPVNYAPDPGVSQFFRRHISAVLGDPGGWDYAMFPHWHNVIATQQELSGTGPGTP